MQVERLRLAGFKSFVDATELPIEPGLTGIVGPNGCGKSNLVEALRWVMGEASARRLRGGEMDDVIFAGSTARPSRNVAEVSLTIDNAARDAPFAFNDRDAIEIVRRIDRGSGSAYRINGREARARDVQLLFADAATGAQSAGIVSQGRIAALIAAKPSERRLLLDEAAGTAGLPARRHEAELKLKGAEDNLLRVDDVIVTMGQQLDGLKRQARQAQRYRRLSEQIRRTEARLLEARWRDALADAERIAGELREAERAVAAATEDAAAAERHRAAAEEAMPPLRLAEAAAGRLCIASTMRARRSTRNWRASRPRDKKQRIGASSSRATSLARTSISPTPMRPSPGSPTSGAASNEARARREGARCRMPRLTVPPPNWLPPKSGCSR
jgi:chromosome segregation protein